MKKLNNKSLKQINGVDTIREFAFPLMAGIIAGAWSSVCVTGGLWHLFETKIKKHSVEEIIGTEEE